MMVSPLTRDKIQGELVSHEVERLFFEVPKKFGIQTFANKIGTLGEKSTDLDGRENIV